MEKIIFEFKRYCRRNNINKEDIEEAANDFMYENKIFGQEIFNNLIKVDF